MLSHHSLILFFLSLLWALNFVHILQSVSPELLECRNLELAVPGTYRAGKLGLLFP